MKKLTKITLLSTALLTILVGCGSKSSEKTTASSETVETTQSSKEKAETVSFFAPGQYKEGTDIKPGSYYMVLTDLKHSSSDTEKNAYVSVYVKDSKGETKFNEGFIREIGKPYRITIEEGDILAFGDNYSPSGWNVSFFTDEDFKEYQSSEKK
ncbi:TPA: hypothetical protein U1340_001680 [Streptococcus suis]|nr:hypothetical protein [Streptococcus suis]HEM5215738.1 hypothetical protein [Streptococcus suis]